VRLLIDYFSENLDQPIPRNDMLMRHIYFYSGIAFPSTRDNDALSAAKLVITRGKLFLIAIMLEYQDVILRIYCFSEELDQPVPRNDKLMRYLYSYVGLLSRTLGTMTFRLWFLKTFNDFVSK